MDLNILRSIWYCTYNIEYIRKGGAGVKGAGRCLATMSKCAAMDLVGMVLRDVICERAKEEGEKVKVSI